MKKENGLITGGKKKRNIGKRSSKIRQGLVMQLPPLNNPLLLCMCLTHGAIAKFSNLGNQVIFPKSAR